MEVEFKYLVPKNTNWQDFISNDFIKKYEIPDSSKVLNMKAIYYDTLDFRLSDYGLAFRVRHENDEIVCTTKYGGSSALNGLHEREEINVVVDEEFFNNPSIEIFRNCEIYEKFKKILGNEKIYPLIRMEYVRKECVISYYGTEFVMSLDEGVIYTPNGDEEIYELEIELLNGNVEKLQEFGDFLEQDFKLTPFERSKLERGMKYLQN